MRRRPVNSKTKIGKGVFMGIDPDVNHTGVCVIEDGEVVHASLIVPGTACNPKMDLKWRMAHALAHDLDALLEEFHPDLVVIEWQAIRPSDPRPNNILDLAGHGYMALLACAREGIAVERPLPVAWKGSVPKKIHQKRILTAAGANDKDEVWSHIAKGKLNHVIDALGLAMWGSQ